MDEMTSGSKPLRQTSDKARDLRSTYLKNQGGSTKQNEKNSELSEEVKEIEITSEEHNSNEEKDRITLLEELEEMQSERIKHLEEELEKAVTEKETMKDKLLRTVAEMDNLRQRTAREKQEVIEFANERLLFKLLELIDDMENAINAGKDTNDTSALLKGVELIFQKAVRHFGDSGVKKMDDPTGSPFDVDFHEALMHIPSEAEEGTVIQVIQPGYMYHDKVLRHAKVVTSAGNTGSED